MKQVLMVTCYFCLVQANPIGQDDQSVVGKGTKSHKGGVGGKLAAG